MKTELDSFETRLLAELRDSVADGSAASADADPGHRRSKRAWLGVAAAAALVTVGATVLLPGIGSTPAYSLGEGNPDEIVVAIHRPEDADGLERELEERGINADITYLPQLQTCAPGRYTEVVHPGPGLRAGLGADILEVHVPRNSVWSGETLVLVWSVVPLNDAELPDINNEMTAGQVSENGFSSSIDLVIATGPVGPCIPQAYSAD